MKSILNKISSFFFFIVFFHFANAQVGINTNNPSRMLDVEGTMKVHNLNDAHANADYDQSIVTDSNGNIDFTKKLAFCHLETVIIQTRKALAKFTILQTEMVMETKF